MTDWAAKVLEGVDRIHPWHNEDAYIAEADALAAIARMGAGDGLVERLLENDREIFLPLLGEAAAHIAALTAERDEAELEKDRVADINRNLCNSHNILLVDGSKWQRRAEAAEAKRDALTAQNREMALDVLASSGQAADAYAAQLAAEAERDALRDRVEKDAKAHEKEIAVWAENYAALERKVARLEGALRDMPKAVLHTTVCQGPQWPDDRPGVWLAALEACAKSVQAAVDAAIGEGGKDD